MFIGHTPVASMPSVESSSHKLTSAPRIDTDMEADQLINLGRYEPHVIVSGESNAHMRTTYMDAL